MTPISALFKTFAMVALSLLAAVNAPSPGGGDSAPPSAAFSVNSASPSANAPVEFRGGAAGDGTTWSWDFGDGITSTSARPVHAYANPGEYAVTLTVTNGRGSATSSRLLSVTDTNTLRLLSSHPFDVTLTATDPRTGTVGQGQVISQNDIYGVFSIPAITGNAGNPEVIVKMVDASGIGQSYWVFYGALTDLTYTLSVREVATGMTKTYNDAKVGTTVCGKFDTSGFGQSAGTEPPLWSDAVAPGRPLDGQDDALTLLAAHPFSVRLSATDPRTGANGDGQVIASNDIFGIFSIPAITGNAGNPEVIVKMVDASGIGQNYWVFYAALTDLSYTLSVQENATGNTKTYNDAKVGTTVCGKFDTAGFVFTPTPVGTAVPPTATPTPPPSPTPTPSGTVHIVTVGANGQDAFRDAQTNSGSTTIRVGDTVQWKFMNNATYHSTTSGTCTNGGGYYDYSSCNPDGNWDSGQQLAPAQFSKTFTAPGSFPYFCSVHLSMMTGTVFVNP
jgi:PKD repeat protein